MKRVTGYEDSKGNLHSTKEKCLQNEIYLNLKTDLYVSDVIAQVIAECHEKILKIIQDNLEKCYNAD